MLEKTTPTLSLEGQQDRVAGSAEFYKHKLRFRVLAVGSALAAAVTLAHAFATQLGVPGWTDAHIAGVIAAVVFAGCPLLWRLTGNLFVAGFAFVTCLLAISTFTALTNGGVSAPTTAFIIFAPIMAGLLIGRRAAFLAGVVSLGMLVLLVIADQVGLSRAAHHNAAELNMLRFSTFTIAAIMATAVAIVYQSVMLRMFCELSAANGELATSERALREKADELDLIFHNAPVHLLFKDDKNRILRGNKTAALEAGCTVDDLIGADARDIYPAMAEKYHRDDIAVIESGAPRFGIIEEYSPAAGKRGWVRTNKLPYLDPVTGKRFVFVAATDITDQYEAEIALEESEKRFALAAEGSGAGIWDWADVSKGDQYWSPRFCAMLGYRPGELQPTSTVWRSLFHPDDERENADALAAHLSGRAPYQCDFRLLHKALGYRWFRCTGQAIWNEKGDPTRMIGSIIDIHDEKCAVEALRCRSIELERRNKELQEFSYAASHDLKSPLRAFENLASWAQEDLKAGRAAEAAKHLDMMRSRTRRMMELLEGLRVYALAGDWTEEIETVECHSLVEKSFEVMAPPQFRLEIASTLPILETVYAPLSQVLRNLIDNALKHHDRDAGTITVHHTEANDYIEFHIVDDGPGVPAKYQERIFRMFEVVHDQEDRDGAGAGLAIVKKIVESFGGEIRVLSNPPVQRGSEFIFTWPKKLDPSFADPSCKSRCTVLWGERQGSIRNLGGNGNADLLPSNGDINVGNVGAVEARAHDSGCRGRRS